MPVQPLFIQTLPIRSRSHHPLRLSRRPPQPLLRCCAPTVGALWFLSIGALTTLACRIACAQSLRSKFPLLRFGKKPSESIIAEKLAACVNRVPGIDSVYWWVGKIQTDSEATTHNQDQGVTP